MGYSEMLAEGIGGTLDADSRIRADHPQGQQLLQLIMSLLDLSKLESGTMSMKKGTVAVGHLLSDVAATLAPKARKRSIEIECTVEPGLADVQGDPDRLRQVFVNLADNAVKFSPEGSTVRLTARPKALDESSDEEGFSLLEPSRRMIEVSVADTGVGIPEEERERIFDAFYQVDSSSTRERETVLGLSIVKKIVDAHGGTSARRRQPAHGCGFFGGCFPPPSQEQAGRRAAAPGLTRKRGSALPPFGRLSLGTAISPCALRFYAFMAS